MAVGDPLPWGVGATYGLAAILLLFALRGIALRREWGMGSACAILGVGLAVGTALYTQSAATLAHQLTVVLLGAGGGYVVGRHASLAAAPRLMAMVQGMVGLAGVAVALGLYRDAASLDLADPVARLPWGSARIGIALALGFGGAGVSGALVAATGWAGRAVPLALRLGLPVAILGHAIGFQFRPAAPILWAIAGLAVIAGAAVILPAGRSVRLCLLSLFSGGAAAALGIALHNPAMLIGGGATVGAAAALALLLHRGDATPLSKRPACP